MQSSKQAARCGTLKTATRYNVRVFHENLRVFARGYRMRYRVTTYLHSRVSSCTPRLNLGTVPLTADMVGSVLQPRLTSSASLRPLRHPVVAKSPVAEVGRSGGADAGADRGARLAVVADRVHPVLQVLY